MSPREAGEPVRIYDPASARLLAVGRERAANDAAGHPFACATGNGVLLTYYFGKGGREVLVRHGADEGVSAHLGTRWVGGRREWILDW